MKKTIYKVEFAPRTEGQLKIIPKNERKLILERIEKLELNPRPENIEPLQGNETGLYCIRQGDYSIDHSRSTQKRSIQKETF